MYYAKLVEKGNKDSFLIEECDTPEELEEVIADALLDGFIVASTWTVRDDY